MSSGVREPVAAGLLYASDPQQLRSDIDAMLASATVDMGSPKVLIVPHGSYEVSGSIAASGYGMLAAERGKISRVIILGPAHDMDFDGVAIPRNVAFRTPLGDVLIDRGVMDDLLAIPGVSLSDRPHQRETSIEVQLPFLQRMVGRVQIVPIAVGRIGAAALANMLEVIWGGGETLVVVSADLSHGLSEALTTAEVASRTEATVKQIADLRVEDLDGDSSCASFALAGALTLARRRGMTTSHLAISPLVQAADGTGSIGYASFGLWESPLRPLDPAVVGHLLELAESSARTVLLGGQVEGADSARLPPELAVRRAAFVSVFVDGELRGSSGSLEPHATLAGAVALNAGRAVLDDRISAISPAERDRLTFGITVLGPLERVRPEGRVELMHLIEPGRDGLLVRHGRNRATFLSTVWASLPDRAEFVNSLFERASIDPDVPLDEVVIHRYSGLQYGAG